MVLSPEGRFQKELDVVGDEHDIAHVPIPVDAPGGVGEKKRGAAYQLQYPDGVADLLKGVTLIMVHSALHDGYLFAGESSTHQLSGVAGSSGDLKMGNVPIGNDGRAFHLISQKAQTGAQDHGDIWDKALEAGGNVVGAFLILGEGMAHRRDRPFQSVKQIILFYTAFPKIAIHWVKIPGRPRPRPLGRDVLFVQKGQFSWYILPFLAFQGRRVYNGGIL